ncbi:MAG: apolipoprotein N-acyltransferase [Burkholderiaceae bacterium]
MRSLFGNLHPTSGFAPLTGQAPRRTARLPSWLWGFVCLAAGALQAASLAWPTREWMLPGTTPGQPSGLWQIVSLSLLVLSLLHARRIQHAAWRGWLFAWSWLAGTFWWLFVSMHTYGGLAAWMAVAAVLGLAAALALLYGAATWAMAVLAPQSRGGQVLLFAALWTLAELARGSWFTGFPWGAGGYAQADTMRGLAPWIGVYGMGAVAALLSYGLALAFNGLLARLLGRSRRSPQGQIQRAPQSALLNTLVALALVALLVGLQFNGRWQAAALAHTSTAGELRVWLLQGNIPQNEKFETGTGVAQALNWYPLQIADALVAVNRHDPAAPQLVVAPETALPMLPQQLPAEAFWRPLLRLLAEQDAAPPSHRVAALVGLPLGAYETGYTNSAWGITSEKAGSAMPLVADAPDGSYLQPGGGKYPGAGFYRYSKHHLVPFGEFIPPWFRWFTDLMHIPLGDFARGALVQPPWDYANQRIAPNICYEDLFGEELAAVFKDESQAPTVMVNLSNIAWFGDTTAIDQHLQISRLRAMELGRPMLRATNTGATAAIDHMGHVTEELPRLTRGRLETTVEGRTGLTPYAQWASAFGQWPVWGICGALVLLALLAKAWHMTVGSAKRPRR